MKKIISIAIVIVMILSAFVIFNGIATNAKSKTITIPNNFKQVENTKTSAFTKKYISYKFKAKTKQDTVQKIWRNFGKKEKGGVCIIKDEKQTRYLVTLKSKFGKPGDRVIINLKNGKKIKCIIADYLTGKGTSYGVAKNKKIEIVQWVVKNPKEKFTPPKVKNIKSIKNETVK